VANKGNTMKYLSGLIIGWLLITSMGVSHAQTNAYWQYNNSTFIPVTVGTPIQISAQGSYITDAPGIWIRSTNPLTTKRNTFQFIGDPARWLHDTIIFREYDWGAWGNSPNVPIQP
jgi:hypothetical protein